jgi:hypothetical protein
MLLAHAVAGRLAEFPSRLWALMLLGAGTDIFGSQNPVGSGNIVKVL